MHFLQQLLPPDFAGGFIVRTMAETASDRELASDIEYLGKLWRDIRDKAKAAAPASRSLATTLPCTRRESISCARSSSLVSTAPPSP